MIGSISGSSNSYSIMQMRQQMFNRIDTDGDAKLSKDELTAMVSNGPTGGPTVDQILSQSDTDGDDSVSASEFNAAQDKMQGAGGPPPPPRSNVSSEDFLKQLFSNSDTDGDGVLSADELKTMVANGPSDGPSADDLLNRLDADGDGSIGQSEFLAGAPDKGGQTSQATSATDELFSKLDTDGDGSISKSELEGSLSTTISSTQGTSDDYMTKLLEALQSNGSSSSASDGSSTSYQSVAELLSVALKSYMQLSSSGFSQTSSTNAFGSGLYA
jgi:Ca2+-binding EF-hand superfamily protein